MFINIKRRKGFEPRRLQAQTEKGRTWNQGFTDPLKTGADLDLGFRLWAITQRKCRKLRERNNYYSLS
jgi:hypothetical protein